MACFEIVPWSIRLVIQLLVLTQQRVRCTYLAELILLSNDENTTRICESFAKLKPLSEAMIPINTQLSRDTKKFRIVEKWRLLPLRCVFVEFVNV